MDALPASRAAAWPRVDTVVAHLLSATANVLFVLVALAAGFFWARRASGALTEPLSPAVLLALGAALSLAALLFRHGYAGGPSNRRTQYGIWAAATAVVAFAAAGLSLSDSSPGGLIGLWGVVALEEVWCWQRLLRDKPAFAWRLPELRPTSTPTPFAPASAALDAPQLDHQGVSQYLVRSRGDDGSETIDGWVRAEFAAAQRHAIAHVAICPPFGRVPQSFAEIGDGPAGEVKIGQVLPYGVRFEIRLDEPAVEATSVVVEFSIQEHSSLEDEPGDGDLP